MTQYFTVINLTKPSEPNPKFMWSEEENGDEKYGFLYANSILSCLEQIEKEIYEDNFEIYMNVGETNGAYLIKNFDELEIAKIKYSAK